VVIGLSLVPLLFVRGEFHRLLTSMFLHVDFFHILLNMFFLFMFGGDVERRLGRVPFLALYLGSGAVGGVIHVAWALLDPIPALYMPAIGASGAVSGVLGAFLVFYPKARITVLMPIPMVMPSFAYLGFWFLLQLFYALMAPGRGIAYWAHIGGFAAGAIAALIARAMEKRAERYYWLYG